MTRIRTAGLALLLAALLVAGCGGGGDGEPTVTQTLHDELQAELDAARAALAEERTAKTSAQGEATRLEGELETAHANVTRLRSQLATAETSVTDLTDQLTTATADVTRLTSELETATGNVTRLTAEIAAAADASSAEVTRLTTALATAQTRVTTLETLVGDATNPTATSLRGQIAKLTVDLAAEEAKVTALTSQLSTAETNLVTAQQQVQQATQQAQQAEQETAEIRRQGDVNARGRGVLAMLRTFDGTAWGTAGDSATVDINDTNTAIEITASPLRGSTSTSGSFYTATLMRTAPGVNQPERKTVVYSDRERSRSFANHYASSIIAPATVGGTKANPRFQNGTWAPSAGNLDLVSTASQALIRSPSLGGNPATISATMPNPDYDSTQPVSLGNQPRIPNTATSPEAKLVSTLSAIVHGVSGHYGCYNGTTSMACKVSVAATYAQEAGTSETNFEVETLTITPETGGVLYFDPGSGSISLLSVTGKAGAPPTTDTEFITFGWWQETPASPDELGEYAYQAAVFAEATGGAYSGATGQAEYQGPAVGLYVDLRSEGDTTIYESGDFTAKAILRATFSGTPGVEGEVTDFQTTHGAKDWHVDLEQATIGAADGVATIIQPGAVSTGTWTNTFLERHANAQPADIADEQPIAVTGRFVARIPNVRHIVGAFGAHRTTDPLEE